MRLLYLVSGIEEGKERLEVEKFREYLLYRRLIKSFQYFSKMRKMEAVGCFLLSLNLKSSD